MMRGEQSSQTTPQLEESDSYQEDSDDSESSSERPSPTQFISNMRGSNLLILKPHRFFRQDSPIWFLIIRFRDYGRFRKHSWRNWRGSLLLWPVSFNSPWNRCLFRPFVRAIYVIRSDWLFLTFLRMYTYTYLKSREPKDVQKTWEKEFFRVDHARKYKSDNVDFLRFKVTLLILWILSIFRSRENGTYLPKWEPNWLFWGNL